jgi:uncharacterized membrane protein
VPKLLTKTLTYRAISTTATVAIAWIMTGNLPTAGGIGALDFGAKSVLYALHELFWRE